jgi:hypothetical protein
MDAEQVAPLMQAANMTPRQTQRRGQNQPRQAPSLYGPKDAASDAPANLTLEYAGKAEKARIISIGYNFGEDIDAGARLKSNLTKRYGSPLARYPLSNDAEMLIWERIAPKQSRDFGPLMTISLTTGESGHIRLSQFTRGSTLKASPVKGQMHGAPNAIVHSPAGALINGPSN